MYEHCLKRMLRPSSDSASSMVLCRLDDGHTAAETVIVHVSAQSYDCPAFVLRKISAPCITQKAFEVGV